MISKWIRNLYSNTFLETQMNRLNVQIILLEQSGPVIFLPFIREGTNSFTLLFIGLSFRIFPYVWWYSQHSGKDLLSESMREFFLIFNYMNIARIKSKFYIKIGESFGNATFQSFASRINQFKILAPFRFRFINCFLLRRKRVST